MKTLILLLISILFFLTDSFCQKTFWGISFGISDSKIESNNKHLLNGASIGPEAYFREKHKSINTGFFINYELKRFIAFEIGAYVDSRGGRYQYDDFDDKVSVLYLDFPQIVRLKKQNESFSFYLDFGQSLSLALDGYVESFYEGYPPNIEFYSLNIGEDYKRFDYYLVFGGGFSMNKVGKGRLFFHYRYFKDMLNSAKSNNVNEHYINASIFSLGYKRPFRIDIE
jgi:hypothetical protein